MTRLERSFKAGTRVRIDAPGWLAHGKIGIVGRDMITPRDPVGVIHETGRTAHVASLEAARLRNQPDREQALAGALKRRKAYWGGR